MPAKDEIGLGLVTKYQTLQDELTSLVKYINDTRRTLGGLHRELPAASDALAEVTQATETAAHNLMDLVEQIMSQDEAAAEAFARVEAATKQAGDEAACAALAHLADVSGQRSDLLIRMMTELSFQDLTCQTINRISSTILEVERRILKLMDETGVPRPVAPAPRTEDGGSAHAGVERLRESQSGASRQDMVDALLRGQ